MSTDSFGHRRGPLGWALPCVLYIALATACDSAPTPVPASPSPIPPAAPPPPPQSFQSRISGIVMDAADGSPIADATVVLKLTQTELTTRTDEDGAYAIPYEASQPYAPRFGKVPEEILGLLAVTDGAYWGDFRGGHWTTVQTVPWGTPDIVQNVRLRPVRTLAAGQAMELTVEPDSSLVWDQEWDPWTFPSFDRLSEEFRVSVQTDGVLTIDARPEVGGVEATLTCPYVGCPSWRVQSSVSFSVKGASSLYFTLEIPRTSAPQRFDIQTSIR